MGITSMKKPLLLLNFVTCDITYNQLLRPAVTYIIFEIKGNVLMFYVLKRSILLSRLITSDSASDFEMALHFLLPLIVTLELSECSRIPRTCFSW